MKTITLHPLSVLVGAVLAGVLVVVGAAQTPAGDAALAPWPGHVQARVSGIPDPAALVEVREEDSYFSVPDGKRFVLVWSWVEGSSGTIEQNVLVRSQKGDALFLDVGGTGYSGRVFLDGPRAFRVHDVNNTTNVNARLVGYLVDI